MTTIRSKLVKDGNSTAVRIPKALLEMSGLSGLVEIEATRGAVIIRETKDPRAGWAKAIEDTGKFCEDPELADWDAIAEETLDEWRQ